MEARKVAEERKFERNRIKYMQSLEETDKENFANIVKTQGKLSQELSDLSENVKNLAFSDKSQVFRRAYPAKPSIDSCKLRKIVILCENRDFEPKLAEISRRFRAGGEFS